MEHLKWSQKVKLGHPNSSTAKWQIGYNFKVNSDELSLAKRFFSSYWIPALLLISASSSTSSSSSTSYSTSSFSFCQNEFAQLCVFTLMTIKNRLINPCLTETRNQNSKREKRANDDIIFWSATFHRFSCSFVIQWQIETYANECFISIESK